VLRAGGAHHPPVLDRTLSATIREGHIESEPLPVGHVPFPTRLQVRGQAVGIDSGQSVFDDRGADSLAAHVRVDGRAGEMPVGTSIARACALSDSSMAPTKRMKGEGPDRNGMDSAPARTIPIGVNFSPGRSQATSPLASGVASMTPERRLIFTITPICDTSTRMRLSSSGWT